MRNMNTMIALKYFVVMMGFASTNAFSILDRRDALSAIAASLSLPSIDLAEVKKERPPVRKRGNAAALQAVDPIDFSGIYMDPKHPEGYRVVRSVEPGPVIALWPGPVRPGRIDRRQPGVGVTWKSKRPAVTSGLRHC